MNLDKGGEPERALQLWRELDTETRQARHARRSKGLYRHCWIAKSDSRGAWAFLGAEKIAICVPWLLRQ